MFPFPFHPSMLASLTGAAAAMQRPRTPPPPPQPQRSPTPPPATGNNLVATSESDLVTAGHKSQKEELDEQQRGRLRHESSAKDDEAGMSEDVCFTENG